jgi:hypothetical protein
MIARYQRVMGGSLKLFDTRFELKNSLVHCDNLLFYLRSARDSSHCQEALKTITKQGPFSVINSGKIRPFLATCQFPHTRHMPRQSFHHLAFRSLVTVDPVARQSSYLLLQEQMFHRYEKRPGVKPTPNTKSPQNSPSLPGRGSGQAPPSPQSLPHAHA